ncbi:MAG: hypothetical protein M5U28_33425 [Sandaracinaceae bacterium]|nr:hypothetical protein [Sandaracinaceae bacterium]
MRDAAIRSGELTDLSAVRADVPPILIAHVERALAVSPEARFESAAAMTRALARVLQAEVEPSGPEALAASVNAVLDRPKPAARPQGLGEQPTMHVDFSELTVMPRSRPEEAQPREEAEPKEDEERPRRYRFGYKERRAAVAARAAQPGLAGEESEAMPVPLTRKVDEPEPKKQPSVSRLRGRSSSTPTRSSGSPSRRSRSPEVWPLRRRSSSTPSRSSGSRSPRDARRRSSYGGGSPTSMSRLWSKPGSTSTTRDSAGSRP